MDCGSPLPLSTASLLASPRPRYYPDTRLAGTPPNRYPQAWPDVPSA